MCFKSPVAPVYFIVVLLALMSVLPAHGAKPVWLKLESKEFVIYSDADEKSVVESALRYAAYRRVFDELFVPVGGALPTTKLILFRSEKTFRAHVPTETRDHFKLTNFSMEVDGTPLSTFALSSDPARALQMTCEFETIWGLKQLGYHTPVWMSQGAGELLSGIEIKSDQIVVGNVSRHGQSLSWQKFFEVGENSKLYKDGGSQLADYLAQARELMHWVLLQDGGTRQRFSKLALGLRTSTAVEAVQAVMNTKEAEFDRRISEHFRRTPRRTFVYDAPAVLIGFRISPAPEAEVLVNTGELLIAAQKVYEGDAKLDRARELTPDLAAVKEAWARRMYREGRISDAVQYYREAIGAGSKNFAAFLRSAVGRLDDARTNGGDVAGEGGEPAITAIKELRHAILLNPGSAEVYQALGRAFYVAPQITPENIAELNRGVFLGEQGVIVQVSRAALFQRLDQFDDALNDLRQTLTNPDLSPQNRQIVQQRIASYLFSRDAKRVESLTAAKDYVAARAIIQAGAANPECEPVSGDYENMARWLDENDAWTKIIELGDANQILELHAAAEKFIQRFPKSRLKSEARRIADAISSP